MENRFLAPFENNKKSKSDLNESIIRKILYAKSSIRKFSGGFSVRMKFPGKSFGRGISRERNFILKHFLRREGESPN